MAHGTSVVVYGKITLHTSPRYNEYQITVSNITSDFEDATVFSVDQIESQLRNVITDRSEFADVHIKGKINNPDNLPKNISVLSDSSDSAILCRSENNGRIGINKEEVHVRGKIRNFWQSHRIQYQIGVVEIQPITHNTTICQCLGCESCQARGGNQTCPPLQHPEYELCASCYDVSPDREDRVAHAVYTYLYALSGNGFSPEKERTIQVFSSSCRVDVVLAKEGTETFAAMAECKGSGYQGNGIAQLKTYLSTTSTHFGIFANRVYPQQWKFYKVQGQNELEQITCDQFKAEIRELTDPDFQFLKSENEQLKKTQKGLKEQFDKIKVFLESAAEEIDQASKKIDE